MFRRCKEQEDENSGRDRQIRKEGKKKGQRVVAIRGNKKGEWRTDRQKKKDKKTNRYRWKEGKRRRKLLQYRGMKNGCGGQTDKKRQTDRQIPAREKEGGKGSCCNNGE